MGEIMGVGLRITRHFWDLQRRTPISCDEYGHTPMGVYTTHALVRMYLRFPTFQPHRCRIG